MKILVTGASGFIGVELIRHLLEAGHAAVVGVRDCGRAKGLFDAHVELRTFKLDDATASDSLLEGVEGIVHLAHDFSAAGERRTILGTRTLMRLAIKRGIRSQIFVSSLSAVESAVSTYGKVKWELEREFLSQGLTVLRPGLVVGHGGLFGRIAGFVRRWPIVPAIGGDRLRVRIVALDDVLKALVTLIESGETGRHDLYCRQPYSLAEICRECAVSQGAKRWIVPVPYGLTILALTGLNRAFPRMSFRADSLIGLKASQGMEGQSPSRSMTLSYPSLRDCIQQAPR
jgi:uncharacterized protein YbjT (DUF2867 family)